MLENILLAIILLLVNAGEYFVGYFLAISESRRIFCWLLSFHYRKLENILLVIVLLFMSARKFVYCQAISACWRIFCSLLSSY